MKRNYLFTTGIIVGLLIIVAIWFDMINLSPFGNQMDRLNKKAAVIKAIGIGQTFFEGNVQSPNSMQSVNVAEDKSDKLRSLYAGDEDTVLDNCCDDLVIDQHLIYTD